MARFTYISRLLSYIFDVLTHFCGICSIFRFMVHIWGFSGAVFHFTYFDLEFLKSGFYLSGACHSNLCGFKAYCNVCSHTGCFHIHSKKPSGKLYVFWYYCALWRIFEKLFYTKWIVSFRFMHFRALWYILCILVCFGMLWSFQAFRWSVFLFLFFKTYWSICSNLIGYGVV